MRNLLPEDFALPNLSVQFTSAFRLPGFLCASLTKVKYTGSSGCWSKRVSFFQKILRGGGGSYTLEVAKLSFLFILVLQSVLSGCLNRGSKFLVVSVAEGKLGPPPRPGLLHYQRRYRKQEILFVLSKTVSVSILISEGHVQSEMVFHRGFLRASV